MEIYKFGGASVKNAISIRNIADILQKTKRSNLLIVVSAMGKTTNALERVVEYYLQKDTQFKNKLKEIKDFHDEILQDLFSSDRHPVFTTIDALFKEMTVFLDHNKSQQYDFVYDQVVSFGELISTSIISSFLQDAGIHNEWLDVRLLLKTNADYRTASVDWKNTQQLIQNGVQPDKLYITQGFIGSDENNFTTTLGREGSDYSAGIFAYCLQADKVTIWKDVPGVLNGDPKIFKNTILLHQISYEEAIELAFYGASVIHPKTLQPLQRKEIPLRVRSFTDPDKKGTSIKKGKQLVPLVPCFIVKFKQIFLSLSSLDFSFIIEEKISLIFKIFHDHQIKVNLIQHSAISFSVCVEDPKSNFHKILPLLKRHFKVNYQQYVTLLTIRHYTPSSILEIEEKHDIIIKQVAGQTYQAIINSLNIV